MTVDIYRPMYGDDKPHAVTLASLQDDKYTLIQTDSDLASLLDFIGLKAEYRPDITGAVVWEGVGDYNEVWLTESSRWFDLSADYHNMAYYAE